MTKMKATKRALLSSALALFLCCAMLIGTTFAWFTDEVKSANNIITAGNLDIELEYAKLDADGNLTAWKPVKGASEIFDPEALWEPGRVEIAYLKVSNLGSLALKYQLGVNVYDEKPGTNVAGEEFKLSEFLVFKVVEMPDGLTTFATREDAIAAAGTTMGLKDYNGVTTPLEVGGTDYVALIVYMPETVGNEANYRGDAVPTIELGINLYATQQAAEQDSFGSDYDEDAWGEGFKVTTAGDLQAAINNGVTNIVLTNDITLSESIVIPAPGATTVNVATTAEANTNAVVIDLNGKTITNNNGYVFESMGNVVITGNGTISGLGGIRANGGSVIIENGNFYASSKWQDGVYQHTLKATNATVVINGGNFDATVNGQTNAMFNASENAEITINGGSFKNVAGDLTMFDPYIFTYEKNGKLVINDGTFYGGWRFNGETATTDIYGGNFTVGFDGQSFHANSTHVVTVYGGTFAAGAKLTTKVSDLCADGLKAVADQNGVYRVISEDASLIYTADALKEALANGGEYVLSANIAAGDTTFTVTAGKKAVLDLNGFTISGTDNLTASYGLINVGVGADLTINDSIGTGKIVCSATNNRGWNAYSSVVSNQRGTLTVNGGTIEHLGGTDMAYAIDNLTNGKGTYAETVINGGTLKSTYIGIRQFCNGTEAQNIVEINGGVIEGGKRSVWMQNPNTNANTGSLTVKGGTLIGKMTIDSDAFDVTVNGGTFTDLQNALNYATNGAVINMAADFTGDVKVTQKADVKITIDGNGKTFNGVMTVFGNGRKATAALTIKNIDFVAANGASSCIVSPDRTVNNAYSYSSNVTVENCTFTDPDGVVNCAAVRHEDGGDSNWKIIDCVVDNTMHSLIQTNNVELDGLTIQGCKVYSKNGINLNQCAKVSIVDCEIDVKGYAVRYGVNGSTVNGTFEIVDSTLKSANDDGDAVIIFRGTMTGSTLTITNTTFVGTPEITGNANVVRN